MVFGGRRVCAAVLAGLTIASTVAGPCSVAMADGVELVQQDEGTLVDVDSMTFVEPEVPTFSSEAERIEYFKTCVAELPAADAATVERACQMTLTNDFDWETAHDALPELTSKRQAALLWGLDHTGGAPNSQTCADAGVSLDDWKRVYAYYSLKALPMRYYVQDVRSTYAGDLFRASGWSEVPYVYSERNPDQYFDEGEWWRGVGEFELYGTVCRTSDFRVATHTAYTRLFDGAMRSFVADTGAVEVAENAYAACVASFTPYYDLLDRVRALGSLSDVDYSSKSDSAYANICAVRDDLQPLLRGPFPVFAEAVVDKDEMHNIDYKDSDPFKFGYSRSTRTYTTYNIVDVWGRLKSFTDGLEGAINNFKGTLSNTKLGMQNENVYDDAPLAKERFCHQYDLFVRTEGAMDGLLKVYSYFDGSYHEPTAGIIEATDGLYQDMYDHTIGRSTQLHNEVTDWESRAKTACGYSNGDLAPSSDLKVDLHSYEDVKSCMEAYGNLLTAQQDWADDVVVKMAQDTETALENRANVARAWLETQAALPDGEDVTFADAEAIRAVRAGWEKLDEDQKWFAGDKSRLEFDEYMLRRASESPNGQAQSDGQQGAAHAMYRLYDPNSGEHFYTASETERDSVVAAGWTFEGIAWYAPENGTDVHRLYNPNSGDHHYTASTAETSALIDAGWRYEGVGWKSAGEGGVPVLRQYNKNAVRGSHNFTTSENEHVSLMGLGWDGEGVAWYGVRK